MKTRNWKQLSGVTTVALNTSSQFSLTEVLARQAIVRADSANTADVTVGPNNSASYCPIAPGGSIEIKADPNTLFDLSAWYSKSAAASQNFVIIYQE